jgi:carbon monoxide dehydrogenase subunit G
MLRGMPKFEERIEIEAPPDRVWSVLGDLGSVQRWVPGIARVEVDGMRRVCTLDDGRVQHETITGYSPQTRSFEYAIDGGLPVRDNRGAFAVEPSAAGASVVWRSSFETLDPEAEAEVVAMWKGALRPILENLKSVVETSVRP